MATTSTLERPEIVNGLDVTALKALVANVAGDARAGITNWKVSTRWQGQTWSRSSVEGFAVGGRHVTRPFTLDIDEPCELGGGNRFANPQEYLLAALNACMTVGYVAQCALRGITLESLEIETTGDIDLRGFFGLAPDVVPGYESLDYTVRIKGTGTPEQFAEVHAAVIATSPNFHNVSSQIALNPTLVVG
jgi:uncharacterized OsmC-like protein